MRYPARLAQAQIRLCLSCGRVAIRTRRHGGRPNGTLVEGMQWAPPCIAVKHLRNCIYRDFRTQTARRGLEHLEDEEDSGD